MDGKLALSCVLRKDQKRESGGRKVIERQQDVHVTVLVEVITINVRHVQVLHQRLFLETVATQVRAGIHALSFRIIIDVIGDTITVQVLHRQLARLRGSHETVVAHVIKNRARSHQIHVTVTVHVDGLREFVTYIHRRASANEHPVAQRRQVADVEFPVSFLCLLSHQRIGLHARNGVDARGGKRPVRILVKDAPVRVVEREQVRQPVMVHVQRISGVASVHQGISTVCLTQSYLNLAEIRESTIGKIWYAVVVQMRHHTVFIQIGERQIQLEIPRIPAGGVPMVTSFELSVLVYPIIFLLPVAVSIIQPSRTDITELAKQNG